MATKVKIRRAEPDDCVELAVMLRRAAAEQGEDIWYSTVSINPAKQLMHILTLIDQGFVVLAEETDEISDSIIAAMGMSFGRDDWSDDWIMNNEWTYVMPDWRETDVAGQLISAVEAFADDNGDPATGKGLPVIIGMLTGRDTDLKDQLMSRRGYQYGGGNFVRAPRDVVQEEKGSEAGDTRVAGGGKQASG